MHQLHAGDIFGEVHRIREMIQAMNRTHSHSNTVSQTSSPRHHAYLRPSERYYVESVDGCQLYTMLVDQICRQLEHTVLIEEAALPQKSGEDLSQIELADLKTVSTLGIGGFGRVNLVKHVNSEKVFALKILNKAHVKEMNQQEHVVNERNILISCRNDFIVRLYRSFRDSERLYMLMEYCPGGEVWTQLRNWGRFDEQTARFYCAAALEAFDYLHRHFIIYRDLKPENMLLDKNGVPKLADFGFAKCLKSESGRTFTFCGTAEYVAPEIILNKGQGLGVDLWALGIFMYELVSGTPPFASTDPMYTYNSILKGVQSLAWPKYFSEGAKSLITKFCRREPAQRLGYGRIEDARRDPWFQGFDFVSFRNLSMRPPIKPKIRTSTDTQNFDRFPTTDNFSIGADDSGWDFDF
uniref:Protein kinase domain-containing protein n=1 Tax=Panagrellus redivivus TaxID=6233 RepID=A0A7E4W773_PANRE